MPSRCGIEGAGFAQAAVLHVRDKGLVVLTGCGHSGIVNIVRHAKALTGIDQVYAVLGGFHFTGGTGTRQSRKFRSSYVADAGGSVSEAMHVVSRRRI